MQKSGPMNSKTLKKYFIFSFKGKPSFEQAKNGLIRRPRSRFKKPKVFRYSSTNNSDTFELPYSAKNSRRGTL